MTERWQIG